MRNIVETGNYRVAQGGETQPNVPPVVKFAEMTSSTPLNYVLAICRLEEVVFMILLLQPLTIDNMFIFI